MNLRERDSASSESKKATAPKKPCASVRAADQGEKPETRNQKPLIPEKDERKRAAIVTEQWRHVYNLALLATGSELEASSLAALTFAGGCFRSDGATTRDTVNRSFIRALRHWMPKSEVLGELTLRPIFFDVPARLREQAITRAQIQHLVYSLPWTERLCYILMCAYQYSTEYVAWLMDLSEDVVLRGTNLALVRIREVLVADGADGWDD